MKDPMKLYPRSKGFSLIELMVAMVVGLLLLVATGNMFLSNKRIYTEQEEMGRLQENARYAFNVMARDIRGAGFIGCNPTLNSLLDTTNDALFDFQAGVEGWEFDAAGTAPGDDYTITSLTNTGAAGNWGGVDWDSMPENIDQPSTQFSFGVIEPQSLTVTDHGTGGDLLLQDVRGWFEGGANHGWRLSLLDETGADSARVIQPEDLEIVWEDPAAIEITWNGQPVTNGDTTPSGINGTL